MVGLLRVVISAYAREIVQASRPAFGKRHDVIDLESLPHVASRDDADRIACFQCGTDWRRDCASVMRDTSDVDPIAVDHLHNSV